MTLGQRIKTTREAKGLERKDVAKQAGIAYSTLADLENDNSRSSTSIASIARVLGVSALWLESEHGDSHLVPAEPADPDKYVMVPRLNVKAAAGNGFEPEHVEVQETLAFRADWLTKKGLKPEFLQVYEARGDSMAPYIENGDVILIDTENTTPKSGEVWVIYQPAPIGVRVKRLLFSETGHMIIRSDNPDKGLYPDERVPPDLVGEVQVIGKLAWRGG